MTRIDGTPVLAMPCPSSSRENRQAANLAKVAEARLALEPEGLTDRVPAPLAGHVVLELS